MTAVPPAGRFRLAGVSLDALLVAVAAAVSEDRVQQWLMEHPDALYHGLVLLHLVTLPAMLVALITGYGRAEEALFQRGPGLLGWAKAGLLGGSFIVPGVLGMLFGGELWEFMAAIFGPVLVVFPGWLGAILWAERRGWIPPGRLGERKPGWRVAALSGLTSAYLLWLETTLICAAARPGALTLVGLPLGVLLDYLPIRVALYYVRDSERWEATTITLSVLHLLYRIAAA